MQQLILFLVLFLNPFYSCNNSNKDYKFPNDDTEITSRILTDDLSYPWEILWGPDNFIWMTERGGRISKVNPVNGSAAKLLELPDAKSQGEGGLLGMVLHPNFTSNHYLYVAYDYNSGNDYKAKIVRYTYNGTTLINPFTLLDNINAGGIHNGCRLVISKDLKLFITTGENGNKPYSQDLNSLNGKVLRINLDGTIPADNPFEGSAIWSYGHRNSQGLVFINEILYSSEHGPDTDDEINIIEKGRNYGWPDVRGFCNESGEKNFCDAHNVKEPLYAWTPTLAVCGLDYYNKSLIPEWKNSLLLCTLKDSKLVQLKLDDNATKVFATKEFLAGSYGRLRDVCISPDGKVYVCSSNGNNDVIVEITKK